MSWQEHVGIVYAFALTLAIGIFSQISTTVMWWLIALAVVSAMVLAVPLCLQRVVNRRFWRLATEAGHEDRYITPLPWYWRPVFLFVGLTQPYRHAGIRLLAGGKVEPAMNSAIRASLSVPFHRYFTGELAVRLPLELQLAARTSRAPFRETLMRATEAAQDHGPEAVFTYMSVGADPIEGFGFLDAGIAPEYAPLLTVPYGRGIIEL